MTDCPDQPDIVRYHAARPPSADPTRPTEVISITVWPSEHPTRIVVEYQMTGKEIANLSVRYVPLPS